MRMLVTGAAGTVGGYAPDVFSDWEVVQTDIVGDVARLDVTDPKAVLEAVTRVEPDVVLHLAAATDVDQCELDQDAAFRTNAIGTHNIALACRATDTLLVYISTAGVFSGDKPEPYTEFDDPSPANVYGHSKLAGERSVAGLVDRYYICRAGWMIGGGQRDKKFVGKIVRQMAEGTTHLRAVNDKVGSPTYAPDLLLGIKRLLPTGYYGLFHLVNEGAPSRYDIAVAVRELLGRNDVVVQPVSSAYFPLPAPRARSEAMRNYRLELLGLEPLRGWSDALEHYVHAELAPVVADEAAAS
jgi:dTDP-4-dehydrorhamnose reductase